MLTCYCHVISVIAETEGLEYTSLKHPGLNVLMDRFLHLSCASHIQKVHSVMEAIRETHPATVYLEAFNRISGDKLFLKYV